MRKRKKRFEKKKNFEILRNNRVLNGVLGNLAAFLLNWEMAMYKTRNTGTGNGMRGTRGMGEILYSGECRQTFQGM